MTSRRGSISDYPEHLNPFYEGNEKFRFWKFGKVKRSGSFTESLRNTLTLKSFRGKKKGKPEVDTSTPELRKNCSTIETRHRQTLPTTLSPIYSPVRGSVQIPLPRSRFSERVARSPEDEIPNGHISPNGAPDGASIVNPFDEEEKVAERKPKRIRRRKRRAPLPPNVTREEGDAAYLGVSSAHNLSKWSLTSVETDISTYSENESLTLDIVNHEMSEIMNNITKEMEKMTDETNDSVTETKDTSEDKPYSGIPDLIASSTEGTKSEELRNAAEVIPTTECAKNELNENPIDENSNLVPKIKLDNAENELKDISNCDNEAIHKNETIPHESECDNNANSICDDDSHSGIVYNSSYNHVPSEEEIDFNERKSIYITASNDELNKSDSLNNIINAAEVTENTDATQDSSSPMPSPRCKTEVNVILDTSHIENQEDGENEEETVVTNSPIAKTRTHKLSKGDLLGNNATVSA